MRAPEFWSSKSAGARAMGALLSPIGAVYGLSVKWRQARARPYRARARVLCIGNLTAGGSGKTPVAIAVGRMLAAREKKIVFLTRGYGGRLMGPVAVDPAHHSAVEVGDEALLLVQAGPTIVARNRAAGARLADELGADIIVMDDGFQNFQLEKDLSLVVIDAAFDFGNGGLIPAGPLRERPKQGLARADAVVLIGDGSPTLAFTGPTLRAELKLSVIEGLRGKPVFAFAGIGRPDKFFATLERAGASVLGCQGFPDHHRFTAFEISLLRTTAEKLGAELVTTEKDYARFDLHDRAGITPVPVFAVFSDGAALDALLDRLSKVPA
jgi:tetraacyldisaccharide 4'-kinase